MRLSKKAITTILAVLIIVGILVFMLCSNREEGILKSEMDIETIIEWEDYYHIAAHYPKCNNTIINQDFDNYVRDIIDEFKVKVEGDNTLPDKENPYLLNIDFQVTYLSDNLISVIFYIEDNWHTNSKYIKTFVYNAQNGNSISLSDVLTDRGKQQIADLVVKKLEWEGLELEFQDKFLESYGQNDVNFTVGKDGLTLYFMQSTNQGQTDRIVTLLLTKAELKGLVTTGFYRVMDHIPASEYITWESTPVETEDQMTMAEYRGGKYLAITFDDGPHKTNTVKLLDILKEEDVKATFYVLGNRAEVYPEIVRRAYEEGHEIGNHSYSHKQLNTLSDSELDYQIETTNEIIEKITGQVPKTIRPPFGEIDKEQKKNYNQAFVYWNVDPEDWKYKDPDKITTDILEAVHNGKDVILLHDLYQTSVEAAGNVIRQLKEEGYQFVTRSELRQIKAALEE